MTLGFSERDGTTGTEASVLMGCPRGGGRYLIVAVSDPDVDFPTTPAMLEQLRPLARPITLTAGTTTRIALTLAKGSER